MSERKLLTIYCPIYNHSEFIKENLSEMAFQVRDSSCFDDIEIVISDNCSTDDTEKKVKDFLVNNKDLQIVYSRNDKNLGAFQNVLDCGIKSSGKYLLMIGDDCFARNGIRSIIQVIKNCEDSDFILIKNNTYSDFEYIKEATTRDIINNIEKISFIGNFIFKKDFFFDSFLSYDAAVTNFFPQMILIMEKISFAKKMIDTTFVAINMRQSWNYRKQVNTVFDLLLDAFRVGYVTKDFLDQEDYSLYIKGCKKRLYKSLRFLRWRKDRISIAIHVFKKLKARNPKIIMGLFIYSLPAPLFYLSRMIAVNLKYFSQCAKEVIENRKIKNTEE